MDAQIFQTLFPNTYLNKFTQQTIRPDGRDFNSLRQITYEHIDGILNYTYSTAFISIKYILKQQQLKEIQANNNKYINTTLNINHLQELNSQDKLRIEHFYISNIENILSQVIDIQQLQLEKDQAKTIQFSIKVSGQDGSLLTHLLNALLFVLQKSISLYYFNLVQVIKRQIKPQTYAIIDNNNFIVDPSELEEKCCSTFNLIQYQDDQTYQIFKFDGKAMGNVDLSKLIMN